jgi:hypothetical protein
MNKYLTKMQSLTAYEVTKKKRMLTKQDISAIENQINIILPTYSNLKSTVFVECITFH